MKVKGSARRLTVAALALGAAVSLPEALAAGCQTSWACDLKCYEVITCCGTSACCSTVWLGTQLVTQTCEPRS